MAEIIIVTLTIVIVAVLIAVCFYCVGYISKELVLYGIRKNRQIDKHVDSVKGLIDKYKK